MFSTVGAGPRSTNGSDAVCMAVGWEYVAFPYAYNMPVDVEEAELLALHPDGVSEDDMEHLMHRILVTASQVRTMRSSFDNELRRREDLAAARNMRQILDPEQAVRYLTAEQVDNIFDSHRKNQLAYTRKIVERVLEKSLTAVNLLESVAQGTKDGNPAEYSALIVGILQDYMAEVNGIYSSMA